MKSYTKSNQNATPKIRALRPQHYRPGDPLPPPHVKVDARETLRRNAEAYEIYLRDEAARMERTGRRAA